MIISLQFIKWFDKEYPPDHSARWKGFEAGDLYLAYLQGKIDALKDLGQGGGEEVGKVVSRLNTQEK